jgi:hypothetical protein
MTGDQMAEAFIERCGCLRLHLGDADAVQEIAASIRLGGRWRYDLERQILLTPNCA